MFELKTLFISFMISFIVSLILLGITFLLSSKIEMYHLFRKVKRKNSDFFPKIDEHFLLNIIFIMLIESFVYLIPFPKELFAAKQRLLLILGGSSSIYFIILAKSLKSKYILLTSFVVSTISVCLCLNKTNVAFIILIIYLTVFFFPIDFFFLSLLIIRTFSFEEWGFALFMQLAFLFGFTKLSVDYTLSLYFILFWMLTLLIPQDPILIVKYILCPLSGAFAIFFLYKARSAKEHFVTYFLYFLNGLFLCFLFQNKEAAYYFLILNLFLLFILAYMAYIRIDIRNKRFSEFPSEFLILILEGKQQFLLKYYGVLLLLVTFYSYEESWMTHWVFSLILQVGLIQFFTFFLKDE